MRPEGKRRRIRAAVTTRRRWGCLSAESTEDLRDKCHDHFWTYVCYITVLAVVTGVLCSTLPAQNLTGVRPSPFLPPSPWGGRPVPQGMPPGGMPPNNTGPNTAPQGCASSPCDPNAKCEDQGPTYSMYPGLMEYTCTCNEGWLGDGTLCARPSKVAEHQFTFINNCHYDIWVGALPPTVRGGGWKLPRGDIQYVDVPTNFNGRFWPRTGCVFDKGGQGNCLTGDCGNGLKCMGSGGNPPASLAEFNLNAGAPYTPAGVLDWYDVSLVDGYNVPTSILPNEGTFQTDPFTSTPDYDCGQALCLMDINPVCPKGMSVSPEEALKVLPPNHLRHGKILPRETVGCKSACSAFNDPRYCCTAQYGLPTTCPPTNYSKIFKEACPGAYSYAYDDKSSLFTCRSAEDQSSGYTIRFC